MKYIDADKLIKAIEEKGLDCSFALKMERLDTLALIDSLQQEQPETPIIEVTARCLYESWKGGTMNDFLLHMNELGRVLNARKEE